MLKKIIDLRQKVWENVPLIHSITNPISINDCANFILSIGGKPIMAEHPLEVEQITKTASALALNIANITDARMKSIPLAAKIAEENRIPTIIDAVGVSCSDLRLNFINALLENTKVSAIKGNIAEINALLGIKTKTIGIDVTKQNNDISENCKSVIALAKKYSCTVMASGKSDIISDGEVVALIDNGKEEMSLVTGTGCILNVLSATYMSQGSAFEGCIAGAVILGLCGELSSCENGLATYKTNMLDKAYTLSDDEILTHSKIVILDHLS